MYRRLKVLDFVKSGGAGGTRTRYLFNAIEALSRLSYSPTRNLNIAELPHGRNEGGWAHAVGRRGWCSYRLAEVTLAIGMGRQHCEDHSAGKVGDGTDGEPGGFRRG